MKTDKQKCNINKYWNDLKHNLQVHFYSFFFSLRGYLLLYQYKHNFVVLKTPLAPPMN